MKGSGPLIDILRLSMTGGKAIAMRIFLLIAVISKLKTIPLELLTLGSCKMIQVESEARGTLFVKI